MFKLFVVTGPDQGVSFPILEGTSLLLGRSRHVAGQLHDPAVSGVHCEIEVAGSNVSITDLDSDGGTFVNDQRIEEATLTPTDVVRLGSTTFQLQDCRDPNAAPPMPSEVSEPTIVRMEELTGKQFSHFTVGPLLAGGVGGMVYEAFDFQSEQTVALKVFQPENDADMRRFVRAMKTMLPHRHPNLVRIFNAGRTGKQCWISMELVAGESLTQRIKRVGIAGRLDWKVGLHVAFDIAKALEYAHARKIVHRNITPENILLQKDTNLAKLADLMLAKAKEGAQAQQITTQGQMLGDLRFVSPEATAGSAELDERSDIYGLGATVYAVLTGRPPCEGDSLPHTIHKIRTETPTPPKKFQLSVPDLFQGIVMKMLEKRPDDRFQTATELLRELERVGRYQGVTFAGESGSLLQEVRSIMQAL